MVELRSQDSRHVEPHRSPGGVRSCGPRKQQTNTGWLEAPKKKSWLGCEEILDTL